jgi:exopolysaccharide production protein ExoY
MKIPEWQKRVLDITGACAGLLLFLPFFLIIPFITLVESKGPVIYRRKVLGKNGRFFSAYKFRTMVQNADAYLQENRELRVRFLENFKLKEDPRITRAGRVLRKYSLDEIPQFVNVLRGEMSLVGPRIKTEEELDYYGSFREKILSVKPGITGLWQVSGRQEIPFARRMELDITYVDHVSFWGDVAILLKTIPTILKGTGAH